MQLVRLHQVSLPATDMNTMVAFYQDVLRLQLIARYEEPVELAFFDLAGTRLMLERARDAASNVIYLTVDDIDQCMSELRASDVTIVREPHPIHHDSDGTFGTAGETEYMAFLEDPTGNTIALVERKQPT